jgi:hypothetical protein
MGCQSVPRDARQVDTPRDLTENEMKIGDRLAADKTLVAAFVDAGAGDVLAVPALADLARIPEPAALLPRPVHA